MQRILCKTLLSTLLFIATGVAFVVVSMTATFAEKKPDPLLKEFPLKKTIYLNCSGTATTIYKNMKFPSETEKWVRSITIGDGRLWIPNMFADGYVQPCSDKNGAHGRLGCLLKRSRHGYFAANYTFITSEDKKAGRKPGHWLFSSVQINRYTGAISWFANQPKYGDITTYKGEGVCKIGKQLF